MSAIIVKIIKYMTYLTKLYRITSLRSRYGKNQLNANYRCSIHFANILYVGYKFSKF